jgi:predicted transcriptional regulator
MESQDLIMDGDLQTLGLQSILKMLALSAKTGTLFIASGKENLSIGLRKGQIVGLWEEGVSQPDLLTMFCLLNKLDPAQAQAIRAIAHGNFQIELALLVERGLMSPGEMQQRLEFAVTQSISHALRWVDGRFAFRRQLLAFEGRMRPLDVDSVLLEALRQADEWEQMGTVAMTGATLVRWLPEVSNDVRSLGLSQEHIQVLCLANGEVPLQAMALALMLPEARVARIINRLIELRLVEVVDTALEAELQADLTNIIIKAQHHLTQQQQNTTPEEHLRGLITILAELINALLVHHGNFAKSLRGRGQVPVPEIVRYLERRFAQPLQLLATQQYPILETVTFANGQLDCREILHLHRLVKGEQLEEFYWEAARGLSSFLRTVFAALLSDEVGHFHTGRQLNMVWKAFLTELDREMQQYQIYRARQHSKHARTQQNSAAYSVDPRWSAVPQGEFPSPWPTETQRRTL